MLSSSLFSALRCESGDLFEVVNQIEGRFFEECSLIASRSTKSVATVMRERAKGDSKLETAVEILIAGAHDKLLLLDGATALERMEALEKKRKSMVSMQRYTLFSASTLLVPFIMASTLKICGKLGAELPVWSITVYCVFQAAVCAFAIERPLMSVPFSIIAYLTQKITEVIV